MVRERMRYTKEQKQALAAKHNFTMNNINTILAWNNSIFDGEKSMDDLKWVDDHDDVISEHYQRLVQQKKLKSTTLRKVYSTLAAFYKKTKMNDEKYKQYSSLNKIMSAAEDKQQIKQEFKEGEKYVDYDTLVSLRNGMLDKWRAHLSDKKTNIQALILALNTYAAPLRGETRNMKVYGVKPKLRDVDYVYKKNGIWYYYIGKVIKGQKHVNFSIELGKPLSDIITDSLKHFKRSYILSSWAGDGTKPIPVSLYSDFLASLGTNMSGLRKAFITKFYTDKEFRDLVVGVVEPSNQLTRQQKEFLASNMRHSVDTAEKYYAKIRGQPERQMDDNVERVRAQRIALEHKEEERKQPPPVVHIEEEPPRKRGPVSRYGSVQQYHVEYRKRNRAKIRQYAATYYQDETKALKQKARVYARKLNLPDGDKYRIKKPSTKFEVLYKLRKRDDGVWTTDL
jgi:hypothetical protein